MKVNKKIKTVLVTGIGGNVGQGILRNIARIDYPIRTIGTNIEAFSSGNHLADEVYVVPYAYEPGYLETVRKICRKEHVDLIIPSTDYEAYFLTKNNQKLPNIASSSVKVNEIGLDKYKTYLEFKIRGIPFAETMLPSAYDGRYDEVIVKPREGRGSRGVHINPDNPGSFADTYIVQRLYQGIELTTSFYVTKNGRCLSTITFERSLYSGMTSRASVTRKYDEQIKAVISEIVKNFPVRASVNIQSIATTDRKVIPFEMNSRVSGTNSIRGHFGFDDIRWILDEYLLGKNPKASPIKPGSAHRIIMDVIYPGIPISGMKNKKTRHIIF